MTGQELRIGNILDYAGQSVLVLGIHQAETLGKSHYLDLWYYGDSIVFERHENDEDLKPITLTPEWLERFGFDKDDETYSWSFLNSLSSRDYLFELETFANEDGYFYRSKYHEIRTVHQLQNLYFALTGSELQVKQ